jgi:hypothetical protein
MLKKRQKWITLLVAVTFVWMMQVSAMPLAAAEGTGFVEVTGPESAPAKSKSILPLVLIGVGVAAAAAVLFLVVLKTKYDIVGTWNATWAWTMGLSDSGIVVIIFTGTKESGTVTDSYSDTGPYSVDGKKVTWTLSSFDPGFTWTGQFDTKDTMSGTMVFPMAGASGTWTATRVGAAAAQPAPSSLQTVKSPWKKTK